MSEIKYVPLINKLPLSYQQTCDLETALILAKLHLKSIPNPEQIIVEKISRFEELYNYIREFNRNQSWSKIVFPPDIEEVLKRKKP